MIKVGITGGIGSGKTMVAEALNSLGFPIYHADLRGRWLTDNHPEIQAKITDLFGDNIYSNGKLDRGRVSWIVFNDKEKLQKLNNIIHPVVAEDFNQWTIDHQNNTLLFKEAAIMFESGANKDLDYVVCVTAPQDIRLQRVISRDGATPDQVLARMKNQMDDEERQSLSDFVIVNDGRQFVIPQLLNVLEELQSKQ